MNPRKVGAPGHITSTVDDFAPEERVLDEIVVADDHTTRPLEMFRPESRQAGAARRTAVLELQDRMNPPAAPRTVPAPRLEARRSILHSIRAVGMLTVWIALAVIAGAMVRTRPDLSVLSNYVEVVRSRVAALRELLPQVEVARDSQATAVGDSGVTASATGATDTPPAPVVVTDGVTPEKTEKVQAAPPSLRPKTIPKPPTRASLPPRPTPPRRPVSQRAEETPRPASAISASTSSPAAPVVSSPALVAPPNPVPPASVTSAATATAPNPAAASAPASNSPSVPAPNSPPASVSDSPAASSPSPAAPPAVVSPPSATPAGALTTETRAVAVALNRYQDAFSALDANAAHAVWPNVDAKALAKAFDQLEEQTFELEGCNITVTGARAEADCAGNARYVRKVGNKALRVEPRRWHFRLRQANDQWLIDAVDAR